MLIMIPPLSLSNGTLCQDHGSISFYMFGDVCFTISCVIGHAGFYFKMQVELYEKCKNMCLCKCV